MNFCMLRFVKQIVWLVGIVLGCQSALGFALIGPIPNNGDAYQVPALSYNVTGWAAINGIVTSVGGYAAPGTQLSSLQIINALQEDVGTPKNIGEGFRRNTPVMYYSFDASFMNFFT